jgi:proline-specific peptidase
VVQGRWRDGSNSCPVIVLHGGPGYSHSYTLPHGELSRSRGIPATFYDQLGCGRSTHPNKSPPFWKLDVFMDQLDAVLAHFNIAANFALLGPAWGGMLAATYAARRRPPRLQRLVLTNCPASMKLWETGTRTLLSSFPRSTRSTIAEHESSRIIDSQKYQDEMQRFNEIHL